MEIMDVLAERATTHRFQTQRGIIYISTDVGLCMVSSRPPLFFKTNAFMAETCGFLFVISFRALTLRTSKQMQHDKLHFNSAFNPCLYPNHNPSCDPGHNHVVLALLADGRVSVDFLMGCHATPFYAHLHIKPLPRLRFLDCTPPGYLADCIIYIYVSPAWASHNMCDTKWVGAGVKGHGV